MPIEFRLLLLLLGLETLLLLSHGVLKLLATTLQVGDIHRAELVQLSAQL